MFLTDCIFGIIAVAVPFTREFDNIRVKLPQLEEGDKTCIEIALHGVNQLILNEWGYQTPVQIILVIILINIHTKSNVK